MVGEADTADIHQTALHYGQQGWEPLPIPPHTKSPPPGGHTGYNGQPVTKQHWDRWARDGVRISEHGTTVYNGPIQQCNLGLRMPPGVIGIDIDHYNGKRGALTIAALEAELQPLPDTWTTTSRPGTPSGIGFYRIPPGILLRTKLADVEIIQSHHRYAVVAPSTHPDRRPYTWLDPTGEQIDLDDIPHIDDLPDLPWVWVEYLRAHDNKTGAAEAATTAEVRQFIEQHNTATHPRALNGITTSLSNYTGSRHDTLIQHACWATREAAAGLYTAQQAIDTLAAWWATVMDDPHRADTHSGEFASAVLWAVGQANNTEHERLETIRIKAQTPADDWDWAGGTQTPHTSGDAGPAPPDGEPELTSTYQPITLADIDPGDVPPPTILIALDGDALFYAGRTNMLMGESESGKTWLALYAARQVIETGGRVLVLDYEDEAATFKGRMLALGVAETAINNPAQVTYIRPEEPLRAKDGRHTRAGVHFDLACAEQYDLAIVDGVTDAMVMEGFDPINNAEISEWNQLVPKAIALRTGAATVMLDHYGKSVSDRRYAIGGQHKRSMITGASYGLEVTEPIGRGKSGGGRLIVGKDRPGYVRGRATKVDKDLVAASYSVAHDPTTGRVLVAVEPVLTLIDRASEMAIDMGLVRALHASLIEAGVPLSGRAWKESVNGKDGRKQAAMEWLVGRGFVLKSKHGRADTHIPNPAKPRDW